MIFARRPPRRRNGVVIVVAAAVLVAGGWFAWNASGLWTPPERVLASQLAEDPSVPVVVPEELPPGYVFLGPGRRVVAEDGTTELATWLYGPKPGPADRPTVEVCVSHEDADLGATCAMEGIDELTSVDDRGLRATVSPLSSEVPDEVRASWETIELTDRWDEVGWVARRPLFS